MSERMITFIDQEVRIYNMTPHPVNILDKDGKCIKSFKSEGSIRLDSDSETIGTLDGIPITKTIFGKPIGLPSQRAGSFFIVSRVVKKAVGRDDLLVPAGVIRDESGAILGCRSLDIN